LTEQRHEFDGIFKKIIKMVNIRYLVKGLHEDDEVYFKPEGRNIKHIYYGGIIVLDS